MNAVTRTLAPAHPGGEISGARATANIPISPQTIPLNRWTLRT
jgi:hypothetical protein